MPKSVKAQETTQARVDATGESESSRTAADAELPRGIFEFTDTTYVDVIWFASWPDTDWMAVLSKPTADGNWQLVYRFRYYAPDEGQDKVWESNDRKSVYSMTIDGEEASRLKIETICDQMATAMGGHRASKLIVRGNSERAIELLSVQEWAHQKRIPVNTAAERASK